MGSKASRGLRVRFSAFPHVHQRPPVQVTARRVPRWTILDAGELQLKLQRRLPAPNLADAVGTRVGVPRAQAEDADGGSAEPEVPVKGDQCASHLKQQRPATAPVTTEGVPSRMW